ncbi:MAG: hypothetical protein JF886_02625 [Candidatus Dormibacteraeota bacterium]|uniref:Uncharacterized protein n=1 Tax=Candidatus Aeolococcus gillhamiae TaxID=3127015 RepID=A0A934N4Z3_9BACT|nr:hypothetical protein [Candidatus Dormibacteraeota bacterium]
MATVDPDDDGIERYVVRRYAHDVRRRERCHQVVAAFDNEREFRRLLRELNSGLNRRRAEGHPVDSREHYTGVVLEPGYRRRQQDGRLVRAAIRHGVLISEDLLERLDLPKNMGLLRMVGDPSWKLDTLNLWWRRRERFKGSSDPGLGYDARVGRRRPHRSVED